MSDFSFWLVTAAPIAFAFLLLFPIFAYAFTRHPLYLPDSRVEDGVISASDDFLFNTRVMRQDPTGTISYLQALSLLTSTKKERYRLLGVAFFIGFLAVFSHFFWLGSLSSYFLALLIWGISIWQLGIYVVAFLIKYQANHGQPGTAIVQDHTNLEDNIVITAGDRQWSDSQVFGGQDPRLLVSGAPMHVLVHPTKDKVFRYFRPSIFGLAQ